MTRLPVLAAFIDTWRFVGTNPGNFVKLALVPALAIALVHIAAQPSNWMLFAGHAGVSVFAWVARYSYLVDVAVSIADGVLLLMFAVAWHRLVLASAAPSSFLAVIRFNRRHARYLWSGLVLVAGFILCSVIANAGLSHLVRLDAGLLTGAINVTLVDGAVSLLAAIVAILVIAPFTLVLPAAATGDAALGFAGSWRATRGNRLRVGALLVLAMPPFFLFAFLASSFLIPYLVDALLAGWLPDLMMADPARGRVWFLAILAGSLLAVMAFLFLGVAVAVTALSIAYRGLVGAGGTSAGLAAAARDEPR